MTYNNKIVRCLHQDQFAPLAWLERLEDQQHNACYQYHPERALPPQLEATLTGLETTLAQLEHSFQREEEQLFGLLKKAGEAPMLAALQPRRQRIATLTQQLLRAITAIRSLSQPRSNAPQQSQPHHDGDEIWDEVALLVPDLSNRLIRYLQAAEANYLPMADYLLGPTADGRTDRQPALNHKQQSINFSVTGAFLSPAISQLSQHYH